MVEGYCRSVRGRLLRKDGVQQSVAIGDSLLTLFASSIMAEVLMLAVTAFPTPMMVSVISSAHGHEVLSKPCGHLAIGHMRLPLLIINVYVR